DQPDYYTSVDIHQHPGGVWSEPVSGMIYERGARSTTPMLNAAHRDLHDRFTESIRDDDRLDVAAPAILDMGCGSAILAIAASHLFPNACVMAADNDPISVRTAAENRQLNNVSRRQMKTVHSAGFSNLALSRIGSYDVILANILARPLRQMAQDLTAHLSPRGQLILSGLLTSQVNWVMQAYLPRGMRLKKHIIIGEWSCLVLVHRRVRSALKHKDTYTRKAGI
ncbi:MAG: 50S ribosomal protein L11 methyltransferase, partial [Candidatus Puniceispirillaceae bacterium]